MFVKTINDAVEEIAGMHTEQDIGDIPYYPNQEMHPETDISNSTEDTGFVAASGLKRL